MKQSKFPPGWDAERVNRVLAHYETQSQEEAVAEDEAALETSVKRLWKSQQKYPGDLIQEAGFFIAWRNLALKILESALTGR